MLIITPLIFKGTGTIVWFQQRYALPAAHNFIANQLIKQIDEKKYDIIHAHDIILIAAVKLNGNPNLEIVWMLTNYILNKL